MRGYSLPLQTLRLVKLLRLWGRFERIACFRLPPYHPRQQGEGFQHLSATHNRLLWGIKGFAHLSLGGCLTPVPQHSWVALSAAYLSSLHLHCTTDGVICQVFYEKNFKKFSSNFRLKKFGKYLYSGILVATAASDQDKKNPTPEGVAARWISLRLQSIPGDYFQGQPTLCLAPLFVL